MSAPPAPRRVAVIFGMHGGMSDVGKFAAAQASKAADIDARVVALYSAAGDGPSRELDVDVAQADLRAQLKDDLSSVAFAHVDVDDPDAAQAAVETAVDGVHAVVACLASRQPELPRWLEPGARVVTEAMKAKGVTRLVHLSSFGVGEEPLAKGHVRIMFAMLFSTVARAVKKDLTAMEQVVVNSGLDYLLVRPVGLTPAEPPCGSWKVFTSKKDGRVRLSIAKADVAAYMVKEAVEPSVSQRAVAIGQPPK